jgi:hypothetical protein
VFGIDKESFTVWFKNRGRNPSKQQGAGGSGGGPASRTMFSKRTRVSEANSPSME